MESHSATQAYKMDRKVFRNIGESYQNIVYTKWYDIIQRLTAR